MTTTFWFCAAVTSISAFTSLGFSIAALKSDGEAYVQALYTLARSLALAVVSIVPLFSGSRSWLLAVATTMTIVQLADGYVGTKQHDTMKTVGPVFLALVNLIALAVLIRS